MSAPREERTADDARRDGRTASAVTAESLDPEVDHVRGPAAGRLLVEYGDYECPYSRQAFRQIELVEKELSGGIRFAFRHFPLTQIHPHALAASIAAEAGALQDRVWDLDELLFHRQLAPGGAGPG